MRGLESQLEDPELLNLHDYERVAAGKLSPGALAYFSGGAMDEVTLAGNREAFSRRTLVPRMMRDVSSVDCSRVVLGRTWRSAFFVAPTALHRLAHPEGELATA